MEPTSTKPYLIRAIHEWCVDNGLTPYIAVAVDERSLVPQEHVRNGEIVLNVSPAATSRFVLGNEWIQFQARFGGAVRELSIPVDRVSAIYARENGQGMAFEVASAPGAGSAANMDVEIAEPDRPARPKGLTPVPRPVDPDGAGESDGKGSDGDRSDLATGGPRSGTKGARTAGPAKLAPLRTAPKGSRPESDPDGGPPPGPRRGGKPKLTRIK